MARFVALLRGVNLGGKNRLAMADLVRCFEDAGACGVRTYSQSGNVVFGADEDAVGRITSSVAESMGRRFDLVVPIVVRSADALASAMDRSPFAAEGCDLGTVHIGFLADVPTADAVAGLDPSRSDVDRFEVHGSEVHLHVPGGMARTRLTTPFFDRGLGTVMTVRNWRTVTRLAEMLASEEGE